MQDVKVLSLTDRRPRPCRRDSGEAEVWFGEIIAPFLAREPDTFCVVSSNSYHWQLSRHPPHFQ